MTSPKLTRLQEERIDSVLASIRAEMIRAMVKHGAIRNLHEAYGVLAEEFNKEVLDAIHANDTKHAKTELIQVAAVAARAVIDIADH